jgi:flagellar basal-body rod modification protein FlgD
MTTPITTPTSAVAAAKNFTALNAPATTATPATDAGSADRFLKLLVTQMQNQDPLNPMDNAQVTSQIAQINTVSGIDKLNTTVTGLNSQFLRLQALSGASLVGHSITLQGNKLQVQGAVGNGGFDLSGTADNVKVDILSPAGQVVQTLNLGAEMSGRHEFTWPATGVPDGAPYQFRVTATNGAAAVPSTPLMRDWVTAVSADGTSLTIETLNNGTVAYTDVKAFN